MDLSMDTTKNRSPVMSKSPRLKKGGHQSPNIASMLHAKMFNGLKQAYHSSVDLTEYDTASPAKPEMWTPNAQKQTRGDSDDEVSYFNREQSKKSVHKQEEKKEVPVQQAGITGGIPSDTLHRLTETIDRNSQVLQCAMDTMESLLRQNRTTPVPDSDLIIPDTKRKDKNLRSIKDVNTRKLVNVTIELKCTFLKITDIDTINQQFEAEIFVQAKWEEPLLQQGMYSPGELDTEETDKMIPWDPKLIVMNIDGAFVLNRKTFDVRFNEQGYTYPLVVQLWRFKGFFKENLELEHFPVDVQDLTISLSTERSDKEVDLIEDQTALSSINTKAFMDQEWNLYKHIETFRDFTTVEYCSSTVHPILHAQCRVARKTGYFMWNIIFIMLLIISLTFAAFTIDYGSADRITVTITLFLTAVAFKLVVKQSLPTISYLTYLDVYVIAALIFLSLQACQNACMNALGHFKGAEMTQYYDKWSMVIMAALLIIFHVIFALFIYRTASKRRRIMEEKDRMYVAKKEFLEKYGALPPRYDMALEIAKASFIPGRKLKCTVPPRR